MKNKILDARESSHLKACPSQPYPPGQTGTGTGHEKEDSFDSSVDSVLLLSGQLWWIAISTGRVAVELTDLYHQTII